MMAGRLTGAFSAMALAVGLMVPITVAVPAEAASTPISEGVTAWSASGTAVDFPGSKAAGTPTNVRLVADGTRGPAVIAYDNFAPNDTSNGAGGIWELTTVADSAGDRSYDWHWQAFQSYFNVTAQVQLIVNGTVIAEPYGIGDPANGVSGNNCCTAPSGGFTVSSSVPATFTGLQPGDTYGFRLVGSNFNRFPPRLQGRFIVGAVGEVGPDPIVIGGFGPSEVLGEAGWLGDDFATLRSLLTDSALFGPGAPGGRHVVVANGPGDAGVVTADRVEMLGIDVFVTGDANPATLTATEQTFLASRLSGGWSSNPVWRAPGFTGLVIVGGADVAGLPLNELGLTATPGAVSPHAVADNAFSAGPFGTVTTFTTFDGQVPDTGDFPNTAVTLTGLTVDDQVIANDGGAGASIVLRELDNNRRGGVIVLPEHDLLTDVAYDGVSGIDANQALALNIFAYATSKPAQFDVTKTVTGTPAGGETFTVLEDGPGSVGGSFSITDGQTVSRSYRRPGTYLLTETDSAGATPSWSPGQTVTLTSGAIVDVTLTNAFTAQIDGRALLAQAVPNGSSTDVAVLAVGGTPNAGRAIEILTSSTCVNGVLGSPTTLGTVNVTLDAGGKAFATATLPGAIDTFAAARLALGTAASALSACVVAQADNDSWVRALPVPLSGAGIPTGSASGHLDSSGNSRWYRFSVRPGAKVTVDLSSLPADYDLAVFKDIAEAFDELSGDTDVDGLDRLGAEFSPSLFSPSLFSPSLFSPSEIAPSLFSPSLFSPSLFSPSLFSPSLFSPSLFSGDVSSPSLFSPSLFSPSLFSPVEQAPSLFSPSLFSPSLFSGESFASAQTRSLVAVSATAGTGRETVRADTWNATGDFYVRVTGKNGAFDVADSFDLDITLDAAECNGVDTFAGATNATAGGFETVIMWDSTMTGATGSGLAAKLATLATQTDGVIVDLSTRSLIEQYKLQAESNTACPYAANLWAGSIKDVVDAYRALNPALSSVVLVGNDGEVPFFRYPDQSMLGPEQDYVPPVADDTQSQSALRLNYILGQDEYGSSLLLSLGEGDFPVPDLPVGRLVETPGQIITMIDTFLGNGGVIDLNDAGSSTLASGYDFLSDAADAVNAEFVAGTDVNATNVTLIDPGDRAPDDGWTADELREVLFESGRHDLVYLAGHFSANNALAADYQTTINALEVLDRDFANTLVLSGGCHSAYNIVDEHTVDGVTQQLDWAQAFASQGATLIGGTGYQYGDTDFVEYSERLYAQLARELRTGTGPITIGDAMVAAKQHYLATTPDLIGLHRKSVLVSTIYGLPMTRVDMPNRIVDPGSNPTVIPTPFSGQAGDPGDTLGLQSADLSLDFAVSLTENTVTLDQVDSTDTVTARYLSGPDGVVTRPAEPALPLQTVDVGVAGRSLRGVGFRGGAWSESSVVPLTGAPTTELRGVHTPFSSTVNHPIRLATPNYFGPLTGTGGTLLHVTPAQHRVASIGDVASIQRRFSDLDLQLFYSDNTRSYGPNRPALAAPPTLTNVVAVIDGADVLFSARTVGDPSAGIQSVWVTYTDGAESSGTWASIDLERDADDPTLWTGVLEGAAAGEMFGRLDYMVQAVNGVGLVGRDDNYGAFFSIAGLLGEVEPDGTPSIREASTTTLNAPGTGVYGQSINAEAIVATSAGVVAGAKVTFTVGGLSLPATTDSGGSASVSIPLSLTPGSYTLAVSFAGRPASGVSPAVSASSAERSMSIAKAATAVSFETTAVTGGAGAVDLGLTALLARNDGTGLPQRTVLFTVTGGTAPITVPVITDGTGRATLPVLALPGDAASFDVAASYPGGAVYLASSATEAGIIGPNATPTIDALTVPTDPVELGTPITVSVDASDDGATANLGYSVDLGDGTVVIGPSTVEHQYTAPGVYIVVVEVCDTAGACASATSDYIVIYDPSAGFVTGGGHIWSGAGALIADPSVEGRAKFGFNSKYKKGGSVPTGKTTFKFSAGDVKFKSTVYDWLVVAGDEAQFWGQGTINGEGDYNFTLTAVEGDTDRLRIKIWNRNGGGLVYDNERGAGTPGTGTPLTGGSIKIHQPKHKN